MIVPHLYEYSLEIVSIIYILVYEHQLYSRIVCCPCRCDRQKLADADGSGSEAIIDAIIAQVISTSENGQHVQGITMAFVPSTWHMEVSGPGRTLVHDNLTLRMVLVLRVSWCCVCPSVVCVLMLQVFCRLHGPADLHVVSVDCDA